MSKTALSNRTNQGVLEEDYLASRGDNEIPILEFAQSGPRRAVGQVEGIMVQQ